MSAPVIHFDEKNDSAMYNAGDIEYMIDTGMFVECPECGHHVTMHTAISRGCPDYVSGCGRDPWSVEIRQ